MSNLVKLNELTLELEKSLAENKSIQSYLKEIEIAVSMAKESTSVFTSYQANLSKLEKEIVGTNNKIEATLKKISESADANWSKLIDNNSTKLKSMTETIETSMTIIEESFTKSNKELVSNTKKQISDINSDIYKFKSELDSNLKTRLDKHSSDIQLTIRNEGTQIQRSIELLFKESILNLEKNITEKIIKAQRLQISLIIIVTLVVLGSIFLPKLF